MDAGHRRSNAHHAGEACRVGGGPVVRRRPGDLPPCVPSAHGVGGRGGPPGARRARRRGPLAGDLAGGRHPAARAAAEFFTATLGRVERQRFILAITIGLALAWSLPSLRSYEPSARPEATLLALPITVMMFLLGGLRIASALPGDPRAAWLFDVHELSRKNARQALERMMLALGVSRPSSFQHRSTGSCGEDPSPSRTRS